MSTKKILVVDDETDISFILKASIERIPGVEVSLASNGSEALEICRSSSFHLHILDFMMPGMDGPSLLNELRRQHPERQFKVAFLTARAMPADRAALLKMDVMDVLIKPFNPMQLNEQIESLLQAC